MDTILNVVTLDWRKFGDSSAVGQLTKKIFSAGNDLIVHPIQCLNDGVSCRVYTRLENGSVKDIFGQRVTHDAVLHHIRKLDPGVLYVRLSPHIGVLELACKLVVTLPHVPLIVHYMDKPDFREMAPNRVAYLTELYRFLALRADSVYTIHESSLAWIQEEYGRDARVLANFIAEEPCKQHDLRVLQERPIRVYYFGSVDPKMNAEAIASFCRIISNIPWISFSIWSNNLNWSDTQTWGKIQSVIEASSNIEIAKSNLDDSTYKAKLAEADLLLLPYNLDEESRSFLKHSFSNKFIDYLEVGGVILCLGSRDIPTIQSCYESGLSLIFENEADLESAFVSKELFLGRLADLNLDQYAERIRPLKKVQSKKLEAFFDDIKSQTAARTLSPTAGNEESLHGSWSGDGIQEQQLSFLVRRKIYDKANEQQSLSATLMDQIVKAKGYHGFDYKV
jgi:glycosyltransferase involved in cell wall biosynthesis